MSMHVIVSGWLLGVPSGANRRLLAIVERAARGIRGDERITVLHPPEFQPARIPRVDWKPVDAPRTTLARALWERTTLPRILADLGATVLDHGMMPAPRVPVPVALTVHDVRDADGFGKRPRWLGRAVLRRSAQRAAAILVPSAFTRRRLARNCPDAAARIAVVPNAPPDLPPPAPCGLEAGFVLHVGRLEPRKRIDVLIRAVAGMKNAPPLVLAGADAGEGRRLSRLAHRLGAGGAIRFAGPVGDDLLSGLYAACAAVALPSRYEGFGLPALEGLARGKPVLVADAGALPETVGGAGIVVGGGVESWRAALRDALAGRDPGFEARARARAASFSWDRAAGSVLDIWRELSPPRARAPVPPLTTPRPR
ncbi:MAG: glycosyltransferase family 1 protein [Planctomycetota bacterium]